MLEAKEKLSEWLSEFTHLSLTGVDPEMFPPSGKVKTSHKLVAEALDADLRPLWALSQMLKKQVAELTVEIEFTSNPQTVATLIMQHTRLGHITHMVTDMFWIAVRDRYNLWSTTHEDPTRDSNHHVGLRANWAVISYPATKDEMLKRLFLGMSDED